MWYIKRHNILRCHNHRNKFDAWAYSLFVMLEAIQVQIVIYRWKAIGNIGIRATKSTQRGKRGERKNLEPRKTPVESAKNRPLITINVNCRSIVNKKEDMEQLIYNTKAYIIFGTESWLNSTIKDHEVIPEGYALYRKDRETGERGGCVFVAVKDHLVALRSISSTQTAK